MRTRVFLALFLSLIFVATMVEAQEQSPSHSRKFVNSPTLPACATIDVVDGNPAIEAATIMIHITEGCVVPWHWHTSKERIVVVKGNGVVEMKEGKTLNVVPGEFVAMAPKHIHRFTALTDVILYNFPDGPFDIHYVDPDGKEVTPLEAFKK
jgi:quercetin dioxygenase-like cupin family protein